MERVEQIKNNIQGLSYHGAICTALISELTKQVTLPVYNEDDLTNAEVVATGKWIDMEAVKAIVRLVDKHDLTVVFKD
jgi:hypothetical protein